MRKKEWEEYKKRTLKSAFLKECLSRTEYLFFAEQAEKEGHPEIAALFMEIANFRETAHARGHFMRIGECGDTKANLERALLKELSDCKAYYARLAREAKNMGDAETAKWFSGLAKAEEGHAERLKSALVKFRRGVE